MIICIKDYGVLPTLYYLAINVNYGMLIILIRTDMA